MSRNQNNQIADSYTLASKDKSPKMLSASKSYHEIYSRQAKSWKKLRNKQDKERQSSKLKSINSIHTQSTWDTRFLQNLIQNRHTAWMSPTSRLHWITHELSEVSKSKAKLSKVKDSLVKVKEEKVDLK